MAPIWIQMYSLPSKYWRDEVSEGIGNTLGSFVRASEQTRKKKFTSYARICVYMDISGELLEGINLMWDDEDCFQTLNYEHVPFRCRCCREFPLATMAQGGKPKEDKDAKGFTKVTGRKRQARRGKPQETNKKSQTVNRYEILGKQEEENHLKEDL